MPGKTLILSSRSKKDLNAIVRFFYRRNGNNEYGRKLRAKFFEAIRQIEQNEECGQIFCDNIRFQVVADHYQLFYQIESTHNSVITVWDARRNPEDLVID